MKDNILEEKLGLEENEAKVYLALLELGAATVSEIAKKSGITRTNGYHVLQKLSWSGLVNIVSGKGKKIKYSAEHPRRLIQVATNKKSLWEEKVNDLKKILPDLISLYKVADKPVIRYQDVKYPFC